MNIKLNEERQKKADELGIPYHLENECVIHKDGWQVAEPRTLGEYPLLFMMNAANRVLHLEQAVDELRKAIGLAMISAPSAAYITLDKVIKETEADHE